MDNTKTKNTHLDYLRQSGGGYVKIYRPSFAPGEKILVRNEDLEQWQEAIVCDNFWNANFGTVDAVLNDKTAMSRRDMFSQFRPLILEKSEHPPVQGFIVRVIDGAISEHLAPRKADLYGEIGDHELEDIVITSHQEISNDSYEMSDTPFGRIPHLKTKGNKLVTVQTFKLFATDEKHAKERVKKALVTIF